jgi:hypothetical protein
MDIGVEKGIEIGVGKGKADLLWRLLLRKFPKIDSIYYEKIKRLDSTKIDMISMELFDMKNIEVLDKYL